MSCFQMCSVSLSFNHGLKIPAWIGYIIVAMYTGVFASLSSLMWFGSLRPLSCPFQAHE